MEGIVRLYSSTFECALVNTGNEPVLISPEEPIAVLKAFNGDVILLSSTSGESSSGSSVDIAAFHSESDSNSDQLFDSHHSSEELTSLTQDDQWANADPNDNNTVLHFLENFKIGDQRTPEEKLLIGKLLLKHRSRFVLNGDSLGIVKGVVHRIDTGNAPPVAKNPYRCSLKERQIIEKQISEMIAKGIIEPIVSEWASPVVIVSKRDGTMRFCVDYRDVNHLTKPDQYPIPRLDDSLDMLGNSTMYSTMDACSAYWQIRMDPDSVEKTTFISHAGLYAFKFMPFGLRNAPATMGRAMQKILCRENRKTCIVYLDDCIVFSNSFEEHLTRLDTILQRMTEYDLKLKPSKCYFAQEDVSFLGHLVSAKGIQPDPDRIKPLLNYPIPRDKTGVRAFLGMTGFYRRFIRFYSKIAQPLYALLKKDSDFEWSPSCQEAFNTLRNHLLEAPILAHYDPNAIYILRTDAARIGLGGHLIQCPV